MWRAVSLFYSWMRRAYARAHKSTEAAQQQLTSRALAALRAGQEAHPEASAIAE